MHKHKNPFVGTKFSDQMYTMHKHFHWFKIYWQPKWNHYFVCVFFQIRRVLVRFQLWLSRFSFNIRRLQFVPLRLHPRRSDPLEKYPSKWECASCIKQSRNRYAQWRNFRYHRFLQVKIPFLNNRMVTKALALGALKAGSKSWDWRFWTI